MDLKNRFFDNSRNRMMLAFLMMITIPIVILSAMIYSSSQYEIEENYKTSIAFQLAQVDDYILAYLQGLSQDCAYLADMQAVKRAGSGISTYMEKALSEEGLIPMRPRTNGPIEYQIYDLYKRYAATHPDVVCVYLGTTYGGYLQWPESELERQYDPRERGWYKEIIQERQQTIITNPYFAIASDDLAVITTGKVIYDALGDLVGVQAVDVSLNQLTRIVAGKQIGNTGFVILADDNDTILAHPKNPSLNFTQLSDLLDANRISKATLERGNAEIVMDNNTYYLNLYTSEETKWQYISFIEKREVIHSIIRVKNVIAFLAAALMIVFTSIAFFFTRQFSMPLMRAAEQLKYIEAGDYSIELPTTLLSRNDDLGAFVKAVDGMQKVIQNLMKNVEDTVNSATQNTDVFHDIKEQTQCVSVQVATALEKFAKAAENEARDKLEIEKKLENTQVSLLQAQKIAQIWTWEWHGDDHDIQISTEMVSVLGMHKSTTRLSVEGILNIVHPNDRKHFKKALLRMFSGDAIGIEFRYLKPSGEIVWVYQTGNLVWDEADKLTSVVVMNQDITERKDTLRQLREMNANLRKMVKDEVEENRKKDAVLIYQSRLAKMGQMIGLITHQWKQPLNNLSLILANLKEDSTYGEASNEEIIEAVEDSKRIINQMAQTIDDFRYFFSPNKNVEQFSVNVSVRFAIELIEETVKLNNINILTELKCEELISGFSNEFSQVLFNILDNAKDAMLNNQIENRNITIRSFNDQRFAHIEIINNGNHINEHVMSNLFEPYFTTKSKNQGTGIGLYMSKMVIEKHMNGVIQCHNVKDGVLFRIKIPTVGVS